MSIVNFAKNKFFEDDDYAYNSVARARNVLYAFATPLIP